MVKLKRVVREKKLFANGTFTMSPCGSPAGKGTDIVGLLNMLRRKQTRAAYGVLVGAALLALASVAHADVKAGVDAWGAGDYAKAVSEWRAPAAKGDPDALFNLAQAYRLGRGVGEDLKQAESLYARAAAQGHLQAADNYGLLLFQDGRRELAMPYISAAAQRGDPRAQYLLGLAHFNGDLASRDWVRAYALVTLANAAGLPQATAAIGQMDAHIPLDQRQQAQALAAQLRTNADAMRASTMAAADLGEGGPVITSSVPDAGLASAQAVGAAGPAARVPRPLAPTVVPPSVATAEAAVVEAMRATGTESPATAGADFARRTNPGGNGDQHKTGRQAREESLMPASGHVESAKTVAAPAMASAPTTGPWKLQLGAFSVPANAERAWLQVAGKAVLKGRTKELERAGRLTRLLAAGWATKAAAEGACTSLKASGHACLVTR